MTNLCPNCGSDAIHYHESQYTRKCSHMVGDPKRFTCLKCGHHFRNMDKNMNFPIVKKVFP